MRRLQALLLGAGLAVAPGGAFAGPDTSNKPAETFESKTITSRARLGVMVIQLTPELRTHYGASADRGVLVGRVEPKSAAATAGIRVGDILTEVDGRAVDEATDVISALASTRAGDKVSVRVIRGHKPLALTATIQDSSWSSLFGPDFPAWFRDLMLPWQSGDTST